jgi:glutamyl-tRNA synthetase
MHLGHAYIFLMAWLSVRSRGGTAILRMEDIDPERSRPEFSEGIIRDLAWLGLDYDEGPGPGGPFAPYEQSLRTDRYERILRAAEAQGLLYPCWCSRRELRGLAAAPHAGDEGAPYPGTCRTLSPEQRAEKERSGRRACLRLDVRSALRALAVGRDLRGHAGALADREQTPAGGTAVPRFTDLFTGDRVIDESSCGGDFALRRSDGVFAYQLAVAADDADMEISEVVRGEDLFPSTPRQALLFFLLGKTPPLYKHLPLLLDDRGERPAKRRESMELAALRAAGVDPCALVGRIACLCGLLERPRAISPRELLPGFSLAGLKGRYLRLPENFTDFHAAICI